MVETFESTSDMIKAGLNQWRCLSLASDTLGPFLFIDISMCLFVTIIGAYFTPLILDGIRFNHEHYFFNVVKVSYGAHNFLLAIQAGLLWINYCRVGKNQETVNFRDFFPFLFNCYFIRPAAAYTYSNDKVPFGRLSYDQLQQNGSRNDDKNAGEVVENNL